MSCSHGTLSIILARYPPCSNSGGMFSSLPDCSVHGFDVRTSPDVHQNKPYATHCVATVSLWTLEQWALRIPWSTGLLTYVKMPLEHCHDSKGQRQATSLEELRLPDSGVSSRRSTSPSTKRATSPPQRPAQYATTSIVKRVAGRRGAFGEGYNSAASRMRCISSSV